MDEAFRQAALDCHRLPQPGKLAIGPTKRMATQRDLALACSPGVAAACEAIQADPDTAHDGHIGCNSRTRTTVSAVDTCCAWLAPRFTPM
jgi:malic enzyme